MNQPIEASVSSLIGPEPKASLAAVALRPAASNIAIYEIRNPLARRELLLRLIIMKLWRLFQLPRG